MSVYNVYFHKTAIYSVPAYKNIYIWTLIIIITQKSLYRCISINGLKRKIQLENKLMKIEISLHEIYKY